MYVLQDEYRAPIVRPAPLIVYFVIVVKVFFVVVTPTGGDVVVLVTVSSATPLLLRKVVRLVSVSLPSIPIDFSVVLVLSVPMGGATMPGTTVVVVDCEDDVDCAAAMPVVNTSAAAPANRNLVMLCLPEYVRQGIGPGTRIRK